MGDSRLAHWLSCLVAGFGGRAHIAGQCRLERGNLRIDGTIEEVRYEMEGTHYQNFEEHDNS